MSPFERWRFALKPKIWPKLLVAAGLGQAIGIAVDGRVDPVALVLGLLFVVFHLVSVVLLNDWGDRDIDRLARRLFPESGGPRTIADGILDEGAVLRAGLGAGAAALAIAVTAEVVLGRPGLVLGAAGCLALLVVYTFAPIRLNYRGGGELIEMVGVGFALPWWQAYCQSGEPIPAGLVMLPAHALLALASALSSGLLHEASDRVGGKRTFAATFGGFAVRQGIEGLVLGAAIVWGILPRLAPRYATLWMMAPCVAVLLLEIRELHRLGEAPDADTPYGLARYQRHLHDSIWRSIVTLSVSIIVVGILGGGLG